MMCFKDMSFCSAPCGTKDCPRQFDAEQKAAAEKWWGSPDAPVAFMNFQPTCKTYTVPDAPAQ